MTPEADRQLSQADIERLGRENGLAILAIDDQPTFEQQEDLKMSLGMRATELAYRQQTNPDGAVV